jgi:hypothetical protein
MFKLAVKVHSVRILTWNVGYILKTVPYLVSVNFTVGSVNYTEEVRLFSEASYYITTITRFSGASGISNLNIWTVRYSKRTEFAETYVRVFIYLTMLSQLGGLRSCVICECQLVINLEGYQQKSRDLFAGTVRNVPLGVERPTKNVQPVRIASPFSCPDLRPGRPETPW